MLQLPGLTIGAPVKRNSEIVGDDRLLWQRHDKFVAAYATLKSLDTKDASAGSGPRATAKQLRAFKKWEAAIDVADRAARKVILTPAHSVQGMLMKIHLAGFLSDGCAVGTFSAPYHGQTCSDGEPQSWKVNRIGECRDELQLVISLREDLHRMQAAR